MALLLILVYAGPTNTDSTPSCFSLPISGTTSDGREFQFEVLSTDNIRTRAAAALQCFREASAVAIENVVDAVCKKWKSLRFCENEYSQAAVEPIGDPVLGFDTAHFDFSNDWHAENVPYWRSLLRDHVGREDMWALEIGSFEGQAAAWLLKEVLTHETSRLFCIDTFQGSVNENFNTSGLEARHKKNIEATGSAHKVKTLVGDSKVMLWGLDLGRFDFVYVDGSHVAADVLQDSVLAWGLLKVGGIIIFDDYLWETPLAMANSNMYDTRLRPKEAIDSFLSFMGENLKVLHRGSQLAVKKLSL